MNPLAEIAVKLRDKGYPQQLIIGDNVYLTKANDYVRFNGQEISDEYVKVPKLENLVSNLSNFNYTLKHEYQGNENGEPKEIWTISDGDILISNSNAWATLAKFWLYKRNVN